MDKKAAQPITPESGAVVTVRAHGYAGDALVEKMKDAARNDAAVKQGRVASEAFKIIYGSGYTVVVGTFDFAAAH